ncbi:hypothetical protein BDR07DRAFT_1490693 [Suillus spraguei]|nr:hypothetical protein BDR07DRAFT_1490693 [Suillus spraguei]
MTYLSYRPTWTTSASLTHIRADRLRAERELQFQAQASHTAGCPRCGGFAGSWVDFDMMDQFYNGESLMQRSDGSDGDMDTDTDTDTDTDMGSNSNEGRYSVESRLLSAYARLQLQNSSSKHRSDQRTREARYTNMHASWHLQLPALTNAYLTWKHNSSLNVAQTSAHKFQVTAVHVFELDYFHDITQQHEEVANVSLLHVGLLGCSPTAPTVAISLQCLELYHQLRQRQSSFSIQAFTKVLCAIHNVNYANIPVRSQVDMALGRTDPDWRLRHGCPPCTFEQPNECLLYPASLKAMDGNNSAKHMANAGIDMFKDDVRLRPGERGADQLTFCTDNWKAANSTEENTVRVFEQTGIFSLCRHGIIQTVTEMHRSGSLRNILATINKLLDVFGDNQAIGSDIGCSLSKTVAASSIRDKAFNRKLSLLVNAFHGHAHNCKCQLQYHPMYLRGFGLKISKLVNFLDLHFDQWDMDKYLELSHFIFNNYKQAVTLIDDFTKELDAYRLSFPDQAMDFETWVTEELAYLESIASEPARDALGRLR